MSYKKEVIVLFSILFIVISLLIFYKPSIIGYVTSQVFIPNSPPALTTNIPNQTWSINTINNNTFDLDNHFSDPNLDPLTYTVTGNSSIIIDINSSTNMVSLSQPEGWAGTEYVTFSAIDDDGETTESNNISLTVTSVIIPPSPTVSTSRGTKTGGTVSWPAPTPPPRPPAPTGIKRETSYTTISRATFEIIKKPILKKIPSSIFIILIIIIIITAFIVYRKRKYYRKKIWRLFRIIKCVM